MKEPKYKIGDTVIYVGREVGKDSFEYGQGVINNALYKGGIWAYGITQAEAWLKEQDIKKKL